ncbi:hypothetical protein CPB83DRAFT_904471 [Crepidotus variabilis]|uniref:Uncharacterized protein n=1 Tax=Crepidotus variabilis TaxID=179855 RepID=A0A9P6EM12_9AGAR|nr:hypothetical protein CPB83DRAFT_904471 [Crepidotus variabilis]
MVLQSGDRTGFLAVLTHPYESSNEDNNPRSSLPLTEFHDWYESEHIPLRLNHLEQFLCGARYKAISSSKQSLETNAPDWLALYLLSSPDIFTQSVYTSLREKRSEREKDVMKRIEVLVRITGEVLAVNSPPQDGNNKTGTGFEPGLPSPWVLTHELLLDDDELAKETLATWNNPGDAYSSHSLIRSHLIKVLESGVARFGLGVSEPRDDPHGLKSGYWIVHEFATKDGAEVFAKKSLGSTSTQRDKVEWTLWEVYKAYPCIAQGNLKPN